MNKEQKPKPYTHFLNTKICERTRGKTQNQVEKSAEQKTHTCDLKIMSFKCATMEIGNGSTESLGGRR